jgi:hypothetical protein
VFFGALALILAASGILGAAGLPALSRGVALGGAASLIHLLLMARAAKKQVTGASGRKGITGPSVLYALRMGVTLAALLYAASDARVSLWAVIPALFVTQAVLVLGELTGWTEVRR